MGFFLSRRLPDLMTDLPAGYQQFSNFFLWIVPRRKSHEVVGRNLTDLKGRKKKTWRGCPRLTQLGSSSAQRATILWIFKQVPSCGESRRRRSRFSTELPSESHRSRTIWDPARYNKAVVFDRAGAAKRMRWWWAVACNNRKTRPQHISHIMRNARENFWDSTLILFPAPGIITSFAAAAQQLLKLAVNQSTLIRRLLLRLDVAERRLHPAIQCVCYFPLLMMMIIIL